MSSLRNAIFFSFLFVAASAAQEVSLTPRAGAPPEGVRAVALDVVTHATCVEQEPNESPTSASATSVPSTCTGSASSADSSAIRINYGDGSIDGVEDVFVVTLAVPAKLTIDLTGSGSADLDLFLFSWSADGPDMLEVSNIDGAGMAEQIALANPLPAGTYYIGVSAFAGSAAYTLTLSAPGFSPTCTPDATSLCLGNGRFRVRADWVRPSGETGQGNGVLLTHETGYFWFFAETNVEVIVKVLDACGLNNRFWVFSGGMTDVQVTMIVTDTVTGVSKPYTNAIGTTYRTICDTEAFATCSGSSCSYTASPSSQEFSSSGGSGTIVVSTTNGCSWTATSSASWLTITSGAAGSGNGVVSYAVSSNGGASSRTGTVNVAGKVVTITQAAAASCTYNVSPTSKSFVAAGGSGSLSVTSPSGCAWTASSNNAWITITGGSSGSGNGSIDYSVAANASSSTRTGTITAAGRTVTITQSGTGGSGNYDGTWNGTTNEGEVVSFTISGGKVTMFKMAFTFAGGGSTCSTAITLNFGAGSQPSVSGNGFSFMFNPAGLSTEIDVTFSSSTAGTGTFGQVNLANYKCGPLTINGFKSGGTFIISK